MPSSVIQSFYYNAKSKHLVIAFVTGMQYEYLDVPENLYIRFKKAFSKGTFFNQNIKGHYSFNKL